MRYAIYNVGLQDITRSSSNEQIITYSDEELVIIDDLREISNFANSKISFNIVAICTSGKMNLDVSGVPIQAHAQQILICQSHAMLSNYMVSPDFECKVIFIGDHLLHSILQSQMQLWTKMLYKQRYCIVDIPKGSSGFYNELRNRWLHDDTPFRREIIISLLRASLLELCEELLSQEQMRGTIEQSESSSRMESLFYRFLENIARRHIKKISVAEYADELCITPKYLSTICRTVSGKSPTEWISEYVVEDINHYLKSTDLTVKEISDELGFPNASFFGKYVREHFGMSPAQYRQSQSYISR